jgi:hypothetical protein
MTPLGVTIKKRMTEKLPHIIQNHRERGARTVTHKILHGGRRIVPNETAAQWFILAKTRNPTTRVEKVIRSPESYRVLAFNHVTYCSPIIWPES